MYLMKKVLLLLFVALFQLPVLANDMFQADTIIRVDNLDSAHIYDGLKKWFITNAKYDSRYIIEQDERENRHLVGRMNFKYVNNSLTYNAGTGHISVVIDIMARDGRFKIKLTDFSHTSHHPQFAHQWSVGTVTDSIPEEWAKGWKKKQIRETYKKVRERCDEIKTQLLSDLAEYCKEFKPIDEEDW